MSPASATFEGGFFELCELLLGDVDLGFGFVGSEANFWVDTSDVSLGFFTSSVFLKSFFDCRRIRKKNASNKMPVIRIVLARRLKIYLHLY